MSTRATRSRCRLLGKLGFQREGLLRERWNVGGEIQDTVFLGLLAHEWRNRDRSVIAVVPFRDELAAEFRRLNLDWIERLFEVEAADRKVLDDPQRSIIAPGGQIFFAMDGDAAVGTVAMIRVRRRAAVSWRRWRSQSRTRSAASASCWAAPALPGRGSRGAASIFLQTNSRLANAIRLYERLGFRHAVDPDPPDYARADVYMELAIDESGG